MKVDSASRQNESTRKHTSLLKKFDIPIEYLDFSYVKKCSSERELEKIFKVLQSGEEGHFPDLEKFTANRLETINPRNRALRVEVPILKPECLDHDARKDLQDDLSAWLSSMKTCEGDNVNNEIFYSRANNLQDIVPEAEDLPPIRNSTTFKKESENSSGESADGFLKKPNPDRIKSWEYHKWDKFDVDTELTKLEIQELKREEEVKRLEMLELKNKQENSGEFKNQVTGLSQANLTNPAFKEQSSEYQNTSTLGPSFIEEITGPEPSTLNMNHKNSRSTATSKHEVDASSKNPKRRVKIIIDDINIG